MADWRDEYLQQIADCRKRECDRLRQQARMVEGRATGSKRGTVSAWNKVLARGSTYGEAVEVRSARTNA